LETKDAFPQFVEVYRARNVPEAHAIRIALEEAGIPARIEGDLLQGAVGELPLGWVTAPRILVNETHVASAREIIERGRVQEDAESGEGEQDGAIRCLACGQLLNEGVWKCPSCGWTYFADEP
jgi:hypothetical protein